MFNKTLALVAVLGCSPGAFAQSTWYVDDDNCPGPGSGTVDDPFCSIQHAIGVAHADDVIIVATGTYTEAINTLGKAVTLESVDPSAPDVVAATIVDATGLASSVVSCVTGEGPGTVISGLTLTGGTGSSFGGLVGGGVFILGGSPTIVDCRIVANSADRGGGMYISGSPHVLRCLFMNNDVDSCGVDCVGGGISIQGGNTTIDDCQFTGNSTDFDAIGGALHVQVGTVLVRGTSFNGNTGDSGGAIGMAGGQVTVEESLFQGNGGFLSGGGAIRITGGSIELSDCDFVSNTGDGSQGDGGGLRIDGGDVTAVGCLFDGNFAGFGGGAASVRSGATFQLINSIVFDNSAEGGGGMYVFGGDVLVVNTVVWDNGAFVGGGIHSDTNSTTVVNSIVWDNSASFDPQLGGSLSVSYSSVEGGWPGTGNISTNPDLINPAAGDFRPQPTSSCIDAADNTAVPADMLDLDDDGDVTEAVPIDIAGGNRFVDAPGVVDTGVSGNGHAEVVDMGPHEFRPPCVGDVQGDGVVDINDLLVLLGGWGPCVDCPADITGDGMIDVDDLLLLIGAWGPC